MIEKQTWGNVKCLKIENGLEFYNHAFDDLCNKKDILRHHICVGMP